MATDATVLDEEMAGLDALELAARQAPRRLPGLWSAVWPKAAAVVLAASAWQAVVWTHWRPEYVLPGPGSAARELAHQAGQSVFWQAVGTTMRRALVGYTLAVLVGSLVGASVARVRPLRTAVGSLITGLQTMPSIAWFPLAVLLFPVSDTAILFVVVLGAAPSIANGLISGVDHVPPLLLRSGHMMGARGLRLYRHVILPASLPAWVAGLKQGWAFAWRSLMAGELLVLGKASLGRSLHFARDLSDTPLLLALLLAILIIGLVVDAVFGRVENAIRSRRGLVDAAA